MHSYLFIFNMIRFEFEWQLIIILFRVTSLVFSNFFFGELGLMNDSQVYLA